MPWQPRRIQGSFVDLAEQHRACGTKLQRLQAEQRLSERTC